PQKRAWRNGPRLATATALSAAPGRRPPFVSIRSDSFGFVRIRSDSFGFVQIVRNSFTFGSGRINETNVAGLVRRQSTVFIAACLKRADTKWVTRIRSHLNGAGATADHSSGISRVLLPRSMV